MDSEGTNRGYGPPERLCFGDDESRLPWLSLLLDAYLIADQGVAEGIARDARRGKRLACARGCSACCRSHTTIPVYPLELVGMTWYATERIQDRRQRLQRQLRDHRDGQPCPFLVEGACSVHPMRPLACRHFNVYGRACTEGEDAYYTRRQDVLTPIQAYMDEAFHTMLPFYGVGDAVARRRVVETGAMHRMARALQGCNWAAVADKMADYDRHRPAER